MNSFILSKAIQKYGSENFSIEVICECPSIELLNEMEIYFIQQFCTLAPNGYNVTLGGKNHQLTSATKEKMSKSHIGIPHDWKPTFTTDELNIRANRLKGNKLRLGKPVSKETRQKISNSMKKARAINPWSTSKISYSNT